MIRMRLAAERFPYNSPFRTTGHMREHIDVLVVRLEANGVVGQGEAAGVRYRGETVATMIAQLEVVGPTIEVGITRDELLTLLPPGGARNALDCALWDLESKQTKTPTWRIAGLERPRALLTTFTCGADTPVAMADMAIGFAQAQALKLKLVGDADDAERVRRVRDARPDTWIAVDANQGFTLATFDRLMPVLLDAKVALIEQPFPVGSDDLLAELASPIPIALDESVQGPEDIDRPFEGVGIINIKLDKCGGLTAGLAMARRLRAAGLGVMVGNMGTSSLSMAPAWLLGQLCEVVDLDGPTLLRHDRTPAVRYVDGNIECPPELWGFALQ